MWQVFQTMHLCNFFTLVLIAGARFSTSTLGSEEVQVPPSSGRTEPQVAGPLLGWCQAGEAAWAGCVKEGKATAPTSVLQWHTHSLLLYSMGNVGDPPVLESHSFQPAGILWPEVGRFSAMRFPPPPRHFKVKSPLPQAEILVSGFVDRHQIAYT